MMVNPFEPATTIWELMDAPSEGPGMNSRNHHMYSSVGQFIVERYGGISQAKGSVHILYLPVSMRDEYDTI
jgi:alpha-L-rhamnosidase